MAVREVQDEYQGINCGQNLPLLAYADDVVILGESNFLLYTLHILLGSITRLSESTHWWSGRIKYLILEQRAALTEFDQDSC